jgi:3-deoxy-manno-octulosonate cytidylyltransferase (CMP-KDO synthetase)
LKTAIIIPARWASTRFPGKPLAQIAGKPLVQHVWERCLRSRNADEVIVATDDMRIAEAAFAFGAEVSLTKANHPCGTDRAAEVAARLKGVRWIINVQGDEPLANPQLIDKLITALKEDKSIPMITAATPFASSEEAADPNKVKVITGIDGKALYFSRSLIPYVRDAGDAHPPFLWHLGIYGYQRDFLLQFVKWRPTPLEKSEKLEQLRALEHGFSIKVLKTRGRSIGVDTPEDAAEAEKLLAPKSTRKKKA